MRVYIGYDRREDLAYQVSKHSILSQDSNTEVFPLKLNELSLLSMEGRSMLFFSNSIYNLVN